MKPSTNRRYGSTLIVIFLLLTATQASSKRSGENKQMVTTKNPQRIINEWLSEKVKKVSETPNINTQIAILSCIRRLRPTFDIHTPSDGAKFLRFAITGLFTGEGENRPSEDCELRLDSESFIRTLDMNRMCPSSSCRIRLTKERCSNSTNRPVLKELSEIHCSHCKGNPTVWYCEICKQHFCEDCNRTFLRSWVRVYDFEPVGTNSLRKVKDHDRTGLLPSIVPLVPPVDTRWAVIHLRKCLSNGLYLDEEKPRALECIDVILEIICKRMLEDEKRENAAKIGALSQTPDAAAEPEKV